MKRGVMVEGKIKWGILGYARIAKLFVIPAINQSSNSQFYAIASSDWEKREECKSLFSCEKVYEHYDHLLEDPEVQAVYIPLKGEKQSENGIPMVRGRK